MKQKFLTFLLLIISMVALLSFQAGAADVVDQFAADYRAFKEEITVPVRDFDALMKEMFHRYPELYHYYVNSSYKSTEDGLIVKMRYQHTEDSTDGIYIVDSYEEMRAVMGLVMCDLGQDFEVITTNGFFMTNNEFKAIAVDLERNYYMAYMGYRNCTVMSFEEEKWDVQRFCASVRLSPSVDAESLKVWRTETEAKVHELAGTLFAQDMPDYMKVWRIHNWLVDNNVYNDEDLIKQSMINHVAYSALCVGSTVCQGYAEAFNLLCKVAGVPSMYQDGQGGGGPHRWNLVQVGGDWYQIDVTWDDSGTCYDYFLITDAQMGKNHTWAKEGYPPCTATGLNYETVKALVEGDNTRYTDYSTELVPTVEKIRAEFEAVLSATQKPQEPVVKPEEPVVEPEDPIEETEEPTEEPEESVVEPEEPVTEPEEPVEEPIEDPEEPVEEPEEPIEEPEEPVKEPEEPVEEPEEPAIEPVLPEELDLVVTIDKKKQQEYIQFNWVALLIASALLAAVTAIALRCAASSRVATARGERLEQREKRVRNGVQKRRGF